MARPLKTETNEEYNQHIILFMVADAADGNSL